MPSKVILSTTLAAALALTPATQAAADAKEFIAGALIGGIVGAQIQKNNQVQRERAVPQRTYQAPRQVTRSYSAPQRTVRPSIPATQEGREIQSALNYFGFNAGTVDGQLGRNSRAAIARYQDYMGYAPTGQLTTFERELLFDTHRRAQLGGEVTRSDIARHPDGTRGLLKIQRSAWAQNGDFTQTAGF